MPADCVEQLVFGASIHAAVFVEIAFLVAQARGLREVRRLEQLLPGAPCLSIRRGSCLR